MNTFNQTLGQFQPANCTLNAYPNQTTAGSGNSLYQTQTSPQVSVSSAAAANSSLVAMQQFASQSAANFVSFQPSYSTVGCLQKEIDSLKKNNGELQAEVEKLRAAYTDCNYQMMTTNMKLGNVQEQLELMHKEKCEQEKAYKELKVKYDEKFALFKIPHQSDERSLFCDECNFEVKSQVALFIHKLNHHFESSIPRHLQLSTRSFSTMPDDSIRFKYKCHCCEIDAARDFARHEIYVHIYQFHTFDVPFKCKFCFLYFTSKSYLNDHLVEKHSLPSKQGKGKRKTQGPTAAGQNMNGADLKQGCLTADQLNSTLQLNSRTLVDLGHVAGGSKRPKGNQGHHHSNHVPDDASAAVDINDLFQQLVGETLEDGHAHHGQQQCQQHQQPLTTTITPIKTESPSSRSNSLSIGGPSPSAPNTSESLAQIMNDLDGTDSLNCQYPGCKFTATTKNHLKFHISAHLMSKYKCPYCTFVGNRIIEIKRHILKSSKHTDQHVFLCPDCDFASDCEKTFRDHYSRYHNAHVDVTAAIIERMFLNESNKVGQNMVIKGNGG